LTHAYGDRVGVRWLATGVKAYYIPHVIVHDKVGLPTLFWLLPLFRHIILRERIQVLHGHQSLSSMALESILNAKTMGLPAVYTDHSLFGFEDVGSIITNKLLKFVLSDVNHVICVSHTRWVRTLTAILYFYTGISLHI
jgi:phosphatidylinositol N-acetylglucosaminyltransferase subunit A